MTQSNGLHNGGTNGTSPPFRLSYDFWEQWQTLPAIERLGVIMRHMRDPLEWLQAEQLGVLATFRQEPPEVWGQICECYRRIGGNLRTLEDAVDRWVEVAAQERERTEAGALADAVVSFEQLLTLHLPPRQTYYPWLSERSLIMLYGPRGIGKTMVLLSLALSLASGRPFLRWQSTASVGVLYVDGEMPADELRSRVVTLTETDTPPHVAFLSSEVLYMQAGLTLTLTPEFRRQEIERFLTERPDLRVLVLDNISCLFSGLSEDTKRDWEPINAWLIGLRHRGLAVILGHHAGKNGKQRGTSGREDALDTVIALAYPPEYRQEDGCHFLWRFEKSRAVYGDTVATLDVRLEYTPAGLQWTYAPADQTRTARIEAMLDDGMPPKAIAEELGISLSYVYRCKRSHNGSTGSKII